MDPGREGTCRERKGQEDKLPLQGCPREWETHSCLSALEPLFPSSQDRDLYCPYTFPLGRKGACPGTGEIMSLCPPISTTGPSSGSWLMCHLDWAIVVQSLSHVWFFVTPWTAVHQASLSFTVLQSLLKLMSIELVMPSNYLILHRPLLLLPSLFPSIRVFSRVSTCPQVAKVLELQLQNQHQFFQWIFRIDFL